jgi:hypothetical protein
LSAPAKASSSFTFYFNDDEFVPIDYGLVE